MKKTKVIPEIIRATGTISESFRQYLSNKPEKHEIKELRKTAILGTARVLRKIIHVKVQNIFHMRNNITCCTNCKYRTAAAQHTLVTRFVSGS
jgi:hypothetical protein